tara:strand:- start:653 stop:1039 length:387 start_codon:yes stop_codon:yes gene_type:complete
MTTEMKLFQNPIIRDHHRAINNAGDEAETRFPAFRAYRQTSLKGSEGWKSEYFSFYNHVANFNIPHQGRDTESILEDVFEMSNLGPRSARSGLMQRLAPQHSAQVGDIIQCDNLYYMVNPTGFARVNI